jgi:hypothetical protein
VPESGGQQPVWLPVAQAALRLGITQQAVRRRIARGTLEVRRETRGNRARLLVRLPDSAVAQPVAPAVAQLGVQAVAPAPELAELRERLARTEGRLAAVEQERDRLLALVERRRWPGLWPALRRLWRGG